VRRVFRATVQQYERTGTRLPTSTPERSPLGLARLPGRSSRPIVTPFPSPAPTNLLTPRHAPRGTGSASAGRTPGRLPCAVVTSPAAEASAPRCPPPWHRHALPAWSLACPIARRDHAAWQSRVASRAAPLARRRPVALVQALPDSHGGQQTGKAAGTAPVADSRSIDASSSRSKVTFPAWGRPQLPAPFRGCGQHAPLQSA
jgi:hypothetical protein